MYTIVQRSHIIPLDQIGTNKNGFFMHKFSKKNIFISLIATFILVSISSCSIVPTVTERIQTTETLIKRNNWQKILIKTDAFDIVSYQPKFFKNKHSKLLTIYIEGDGLAWLSKSIISQNPTPINPLALKLALQHPNQSVAYLARPCQFTPNSSKNCKASYWTNARFSTKVIQSMNKAIQTLITKNHAESIILVGYSGGATVAALIAAQRTDVKMLVTVAGNLNHQKWTQLQKISPLNKSLNPVDYIQQLSKIKQTHLIGEHDKIMPKSVIDSYIQKLPNKNTARVKVMQNYNHHCCWVKNWKSIWNGITRTQ